MSFEKDSLFCRKPASKWRSNANSFAKDLDFKKVRRFLLFDALSLLSVEGLKYIYNHPSWIVGTLEMVGLLKTSKHFVVIV